MFPRRISGDNTTQTPQDAEASTTTSASRALLERLRRKFPKRYFQHFLNASSGSGNRVPLSEDQPEHPTPTADEESVAEQPNTTAEVHHEGVENPCYRQSPNSSTSNVVRKVLVVGKFKLLHSYSPTAKVRPTHSILSQQRLNAPEE